MNHPFEPSIGSIDSNVGLRSGGTKPKSTPGRRRHLTPKQRYQSWRSFLGLCSQEWIDEPLRLWWTLLIEEKAYEPHSWMANLIDRGQWDGYLEGLCLLDDYPDDYRDPNRKDNRWEWIDPTVDGRPF
jgi:hypothetical protein